MMLGKKVFITTYDSICELGTQVEVFLPVQVNK